MLTPLSAEEAGYVATSVFDWFGFLLVAAAGIAYSLIVGGTKSAAEEGEPLKTRARVRAQMWLWSLGGFMVLIAIFSLDDVARLAVTFKPWGALVLVIYLWPIWFIARLFSLNSDDVADYSFDAVHRQAIDAKWQKQMKGNSILRRELSVWIAAIVGAILWLLHLVNLPFRTVFSFFN
jgi:hypothetical protein